MKLFRARYLLPIATPPIEGGALLVGGGRIVAAGPFAELRRATADLVDFGDAVLLPPLVNAHTHLELTNFPEWAAKAGESGRPETFVDWILQVIRIKRQLSGSLFAPSVMAGIEESLRAGTGAVGDVLSWYPARSAHRNSPLRGCLFLEVLGRDYLTIREHFGRALDLLPEERAGRLSLGLSPHSPYTLSAAYLEQVVETARRRRTPVTIHLAESAAECEFLQTSGGPLAEVFYPFVGWEKMLPPPAACLPVSYLAERGGLGEGTLLAHGVQVDRADADRIAAAGACVVLCPRSNARTGVGRAPLRLYLDAGVHLALGTDSRASVDSLSVWDELAFARRWFEGEADPRTLLRIATRGGARALRLEGEMGVLEPGTGVHFQVLQPEQLPPLPELEEFLCTPGRTSEVRHLLLDGCDVLQ